RGMDLRHEAVDWVLTEPNLRDQPDLWSAALDTEETVRQRVLSELHKRARSEPGTLNEWDELTPGRVQALWARLLLALPPVGRAHPTWLVEPLRLRLERRPREAPHLVPLLGRVLQSTRGPAWRNALVALVQLAENDPTL